MAQKKVLSGMGRYRLHRYRGDAPRFWTHQHNDILLQTVQALHRSVAHRRVHRVEDAEGNFLRTGELEPVILLSER